LRTLALFFALAAGAAESDILFDAARKGDVTRIRAALDNGVPVDAKWRYGQTALFIAAFHGHTDAAKLLVERGADVNVTDTFYSFTALNAAAQKDNVAIVNLLLDKGAAGGDGLLKAAAGTGKTEMVKSLLARPGWKPEVLSDALSAADSRKHVEITKLLKEAGAKPRALVQEAK